MALIMVYLKVPKAFMVTTVYTVVNVRQRITFVTTYWAAFANMVID